LKKVFGRTIALDTFDINGRIIDHLEVTKTIGKR